MQHSNLWYIIHKQSKRKGKKNTLKIQNHKKKTTYDEPETKTVSKNEPLKPTQAIKISHLKPCMTLEP